MDNGKIDTNKLIDVISENNKKNKKSLYILLGMFFVGFAIMIILYIINRTSLYLYISIMCLLIVFVDVIVIVFKNKITNQKTSEILKYKDEIDSYCKYIGKYVYSTANRLLIIEPNYKPFKQADFNSIVSCSDGKAVEIAGDDYIEYPTIIVTMIDKRKIVFKSSEELKQLLCKYYSKDDQEKINKKNEPMGKLIQSSVINDFYKFDDYQQGFIDLPLFNEKECSLWIDSDVSVDYANKVVSVIKELREEDIDCAKESTVWYYNNDLKEYGYRPDLINIPLRLKKEDVLKYLKLEEIYIRKQKNNEVLYTIWFETEMEPEHGISWVFKDKKNIYVGSGSDIDENDLNVEFNFAKGYHQEVKLTDDEYFELEQNVKEKNK